MPSRPKGAWHEYKVVVLGFRQWLEADGWTVEIDKNQIDVVAQRGDEKIIAEAKGQATKPIGVNSPTCAFDLRPNGACRS